MADRNPATPERLNHTNLQYSRSARLWCNLRLAIGRWINRYVEPARELDFIEHRHYVRKARSPGNRLTPAEVGALSRYMLDVQDLDLRRAHFKAVDIERTFQGLLLPLVRELLKRDPSVRRVVNVGVNYAHVDFLLAQEFPTVQFTAVDFARNLADFNKDLQRDNLDYVSGYALELFEQGRLNADVVMMSSVAYEIKNPEIRLYLETVANRSRYIILNEPIYLMPGGAVIDPDQVSLEESKPVFSYAGRTRRQPGPLALVHNYRAMLEAAGFEILHYRVFRPSFTDLRMVNVVATARR